jgi:hypothetical protein
MPPIAILSFNDPIFVTIGLLNGYMAQIWMSKYWGKGLFFTVSLIFGGPFFAMLSFIGKKIAIKKMLKN